VSLVLSLFPGIGLLDRAFEETGFCVVRGPDVLWGGDIRGWHPPLGRFDGILGGPPCQTFSALANLVRAKGHEPRFGNLIPEFERCVGEARPAWFLMENVPQAPEPQIEGYGVTAFVLDNCSLDSGDGYGEQQERKRRFSFGQFGVDVPPDLRRWIRQAALLLPRAGTGTVTQTHVNNSQEAKGRIREQCAIDPRAVPVAIGGSGKLKPGARVPAVTSSDGAGKVARRERHVAVTGAHSGGGRPKGGHQIVYRRERMLELQGLPPDFLADAPFTVEGKRKAVANGVPLPMGRAIAQAVRYATEGR
jgi:site-specific DNA-cytosine methylase